jgi:hypothetical protein
MIIVPEFSNITTCLLLCRLLYLESVSLYHKIKKTPTPTATKK